ncbi:hypothetical protein GCM10025873_09970 [Demequina sediminis]|nr:hypothetical protein GCM10025873_09970 [Demequina sediminis]
MRARQVSRKEAAQCSAMPIHSEGNNALRWVVTVTGAPCRPAGAPNWRAPRMVPAPLREPRATPRALLAAAMGARMREDPTV